MTPQTPTDLQTYINTHHIAAEIVIPPQETPTVPAAAEAMGCDVDQIIKSVLFLIDDQAPAPPRPVLVIACGTALINYKALSSRFGVGRKKIRLAPPDVVLTTLGYPAGGVPPFGHLTPVPVLLDEAVTRQQTIYGGGGDDHSLVHLTVAELMRVTQPEVLAATNQDTTSDSAGETP
jgi:prolyl-tRNA editing enzyme YbaK/EbsC (Cys-tRNA(Pro) deacylase)